MMIFYWWNDIRATCSILVWCLLNRIVISLNNFSVIFSCIQQILSVRWFKAINFIWYVAASALPPPPTMFFYLCLVIYICFYYLQFIIFINYLHISLLNFSANVYFGTTVFTIIFLFFIPLPSLTCS